MKKAFQFTTFCFCLFLASSLSAQEWSGATSGTNGSIYRTGQVGVGLNSPNANYKLHVETANMGDGTAAVYGEILQPLNAADRVRGVYGRVESGAGWAYGVYGSAATQNPSSAGRSFGVFGVGGNATAGANYGGQFQLFGDNGGAAMLAVDRLTPEGETWAFTNGLLDASRSWAGYFIGDVQMTMKLGIGDCDTYTAPATGTVDYHLFVDGGIRAQEVHIDDFSWCDYVFESDYELTSLEEVETHIETKGHLHNTPSAEELEANGGYELGEMTRNQQEKIEEIFLHLIDLNKEVETLKAENAELKAALATKE